MHNAVSLATFLSADLKVPWSALTGDCVPPSFVQFINDTMIVTANASLPALMPAAASANMDQTYFEFIDQLISNLTREKSGNVLAYGYVDAATSGSSSAAFSAHVNFNVNIVKLALWHHVHDLIGRNAFMTMVWTVRAYRLGADGNYYQIFGPGIRFRNSFSATKKATPLTVSRTTYREKLKGEAILNKDSQEIVSLIIAEAQPSRKTVKAFSGLKKLLDLAIIRDKKNNYLCMYASIVGTEKLSSDHSIGNPTPPHTVLRMVVVVVSSVFALSVWGSKRNKAVLFDAISRLVFQKGHERAQLNALAERLRLSDISWLGKSTHTTSKQDFERRRHHLLLFLNWFFNSFVNQAISRFWYVVEAGQDGQCLLHYPHRQWKHATRPWLNTYAEKYLIPCDMTKTSVPNPTSFYNFGWMRLLPKRNDFRMLCVPSKTPWLGMGEPRDESYIRQFKSYDSNQVRPIREIIDAQSKQKREPTRASYPICYSFRDVAEQVALFKARMTKKYGTEVAFHLIKFDMKHCYDQLDQKKIIECVDSLLSPTEPDLVFHSRTIWDCTDDIERIKKSKTIVQNQKSVELFENATLGSCNSRTKLYIDSGKNKRFSKRAIMEFVRNQVYESFCMVRGPKLAYKRRIGVFQGFPLLSCFCDVVYNQMVMEQFSFVLAPSADAVLVRLVDDFLVISTRKDIIAKTLEVVAGPQLHQYGAYANDAKTMVSDPDAPAITTFAGLDIDTSSLAVWRTYAHGSIKFPNAVASLSQLVEYLKTRFRSCLDDVSISTALNTIHVALENLKRLLRAILEAFVSKDKILKKAGHTLDGITFKAFMLELMCVALEKFQRLNHESQHYYDDVVRVFNETMAETLPSMDPFYNDIVASVLEWLH